MRDASLCLSVKAVNFNETSEGQTISEKKKKKRQEKKKREERAKIKQILAKVSFRTTVLFNCLNRFPPFYLAGFPCIDFVHWCLVFSISFNCHRKATEVTDSKQCLISGQTMWIKIHVQWAPGHTSLWRYHCPYYEVMLLLTTSL